MRASAFVSLAAASLLISMPVLAQARAGTQNPAQRLSIANSPAVRAGAAVSDGNSARGGGGWIIGAIGVIAGVVYAFIQKDNDDDDFSASPD